jgi:cell division protein FtsW
VTAQAIRHPGEFRWETRLLAVVTLILTAIGIATCYAVGVYLPKWFHEATQQGIAALVGGVLFLFAARTDYRIWRKAAFPLFLVTIAGLVPIAIVAAIWKGGHAPGMLDKVFPVINSARRWIFVGARVQVSEIARFTLAAWLAARAATLGSRLRDFKGGFLPLMGVVALVCILVGIEPSLSMAVTLAVVGLTVLFTAGARIPHLVLVALTAAAAVTLVLKFETVRSKRAETFRQPALACEVGGQECEALIGFGTGGLTGVGFGKGTQMFGHTPDAYSDYILSVVGEEWGLLGTIFVTLCFGVFCAMGFRIARTAPDPFGTYLAAGLTTAVGVTAFMHAAVLTRLMPSTGLTLPFISVGRVSLLLYLFSAGVIVSIGRQRGRPARAK